MTYQEAFEQMTEGLKVKKRKISIQRYNPQLAKCIAGGEDDQNDYIVVEEEFETSSGEESFVHAIRILSIDEYSGALSAAKRLRWFFDPDGRKILDLVCADLRRDMLELIDEHHGERFVKSVLFWRITCSIVPLIWDRLWRVVSNLLPIALLLKRFKRWRS